MQQGLDYVILALAVIESGVFVLHFLVSYNTIILA